MERARPVVLGEELDARHARLAVEPFVDEHSEHALALVVSGRRPEVTGATRVAAAVLEPLALEAPLERRHWRRPSVRDRDGTSRSARPAHRPRARTPIG